jgi:hypothetical protein
MLNNKPNNRERAHILKISANFPKVKISKNLENSWKSLKLKNLKTNSSIFFNITQKNREKHAQNFKILDNFWIVQMFEKYWNFFNIVESEKCEKLFYNIE